SLGSGFPTPDFSGVLYEPLSRYLTEPQGVRRGVRGTRCGNRRQAGWGSRAGRITRTHDGRFGRADLRSALDGLPRSGRRLAIFDPGALNQPSVWLQRLSPAVSYIGWAKAVTLFISVAMVWRARGHARAPETSDRPTFARYFRASTE